MGGNIKNLDLLLSRNKPLSISEFRKVVNDDIVASVVTLESTKKFHLRYEIRLHNGKSYDIYVKMSSNQILKLINLQKSN